MERGGAGDAGNGGKWRGRSQARSEHQNPITHSGPRGGDHLSPSQLTDVARLQFADVFSPLPGRTNLIQHHIETEPGIVVRSRPYRLPEHKKKVVQSELEAMLEMGVIEESHSDPAWVGRWGYVARGAWFSEVCSGRKTQETAVSKWVKCKMRNTCVWLQ